MSECEHMKAGPRGWPPWLQCGLILHRSIAEACCFDPLDGFDPLLTGRVLDRCRASLPRFGMWPPAIQAWLAKRSVCLSAGYWTLCHDPASDDVMPALGREMRGARAVARTRGWEVAS